MHVFYTPEFGFSYVREAILADKVLSAYLEKKGEAGLYYLFAFGHPVSPYAAEINLKERDRAVNAEIISKRIGAKNDKERFKGVPGEYESPDYPAALEAALRLRCTPNLVHISFLEDEIQLTQELIREVSKKMTQPVKAGASDDQSVHIKNKKDLRAYLNDIKKDLWEAQAKFKSMVEATGLISMDSILDDIG